MANLRLCISRFNYDQNNRVILQRDNIYFQNRYKFQLFLNNTRLRLYEEICISNVVDDANVTEWETIWEIISENV